MAMKIQILGSGCPKCDALAANAKAAADELGVDYELVKVTGVNDIIAMGVMLTPALAVDGDVKFSGKVASVGEIKELLAEG